MVGSLSEGVGNLALSVEDNRDANSSAEANADSDTGRNAAVESQEKKEASITESGPIVVEEEEASITETEEEQGAFPETEMDKEMRVHPHVGLSFGNAPPFSTFPVLHEDKKDAENGDAERGNSSAGQGKEEGQGALTK